MTELPPEVAGLLRQRAERRAARDWEAADALRDRLHAAGWEPIDSPGGSTARPRLPDAPAEDAPTTLSQPATIALSVVLVADDHVADVDRFLEALRRHPPATDWELLLVANAPSEALAPIDRLPLRVLPSDTRLGWADAVNLGLRSAGGEVIVLADPSVEPTGAWADPLLAALEEPGVGLAGPWGVRSADGRQFSDAPPGEVDAVQAYLMAVRREALQAIGGFDHRFRFYRNADLDLSFAVRDAGWRAVATVPLPLRRHEQRAYAALPDAELERLSRRNFYRFLKHWGDRRDLLLQPGPRPGEGARK